MTENRFMALFSLIAFSTLVSIAVTFYLLVHQ
jgi:hypothetical protein